MDGIFMHLNLLCTYSSAISGAFNSFQYLEHKKAS